MLSSNTGKYEPEKAPYLDSFHAVMKNFQEKDGKLGLLNISLDCTSKFFPID